MNIFGSASRRYRPVRLVVLPLAVLIAAAALTIAVATAPTTPIWVGTFGELTREGPLSLRGDGTPREYIFTVTLVPSADNTEQGRTASASYQWFGAHSTAGRNHAPAR